MNHFSYEQNVALLNAIKKHHIIIELGLVVNLEKVTSFEFKNDCTCEISFDTKSYTVHSEDIVAKIQKYIEERLL